MLIGLKDANDGKHKYIAIFQNGKQVRFGQAGASDYTQHHDQVRKNNYIRRHAADLETKDPYRAGYLARYILWNLPTIHDSIDDYNRRFFKH